MEYNILAIKHGTLKYIKQFQLIDGGCSYDTTRIKREAYRFDHKTGARAIEELELAEQIFPSNTHFRLVSRNAINI